ncbi:H-NS histone family protein [Nostoc sp. CHAB 5834]|nr:H-NS histone family protein [Nostoc sp. CHAB 5834]
MSDNSTLKVLLQQREELERQIREATTKERGEALTSIRDLVATYQIDASEVFGNKRGRPSMAKGANKGTRPPVLPKYRNPESGETWTGRGMKPKWVTAALSSGKKMEDLAI